MGPSQKFLAGAERTGLVSQLGIKFYLLDQD